MYIPTEQFEQYRNAINVLKASTAKELEDMLHKAWSGPGRSDKELLRRICTQYAKSIAQKYGLAAATVSAAMWEDIYHHDTGSRLEALIPDDEDLDNYFGAAAETIVGEKIEGNDWDGALKFLTGITTRAVHDYARKTQVSNTNRVARSHRKGASEARWARIPTGDRTCAWCIMLASRGFAYVSEWTALFRGDGEKYHTDCDCECLASFSNNSGVQGYDWSRYEEMYTESRAYDELGRVDMRQTLHNMRQKYRLKS